MGRPQLERRVIDSRVGGLGERQRERVKRRLMTRTARKNLKVPDPTFHAGFRVHIFLSVTIREM